MYLPNAHFQFQESTQVKTFTSFSLGSTRLAVTHTFALLFFMILRDFEEYCSDILWDARLL
jgi:hypothetical protein